MALEADWNKLCYHGKLNRGLPISVSCFPLSLSPRADKSMIRVFSVCVCVWPAELNCCIPAGCTQVFLNLPSNFDLLSKQLWICETRKTHRLGSEAVRAGTSHVAVFCQQICHDTKSYFLSRKKENCKNAFPLHCRRMLFLRPDMHSRGSQQPEINTVTPQRNIPQGLSHSHAAMSDASERKSQKSWFVLHSFCRYRTTKGSRTMR